MPSPPMMWTSRSAFVAVAAWAVDVTPVPYDAGTGAGDDGATQSGYGGEVGDDRAGDAEASMGAA